MEPEPEILINSSLVTHGELGDVYEFVINDQLKVIECIQIESLSEGTIKRISNAAMTLDNLLFELNHVRVNPKVDNSYIIDCLTQALNDIGVEVFNTPHANSMAICFKPLGEISDNVRFYLDKQGKVVFLSPATKPKLVSINNSI